MNKKLQIALLLITSYMICAAGCSTPGEGYYGILKKYGKLYQGRQFSPSDTESKRRGRMLLEKAISIHCDEKPLTSITMVNSVQTLRYLIPESLQKHGIMVEISARIQLPGKYRATITANGKTMNIVIDGKQGTRQKGHSGKRTPLTTKQRDHIKNTINEAIPLFNLIKPLTEAKKNVYSLPDSLFFGRVCHRIHVDHSRWHPSIIFIDKKTGLFAGVIQYKNGFIIRHFRKYMKISKIWTWTETDMISPHSRVEITYANIKFEKHKAP